MESVSKGVRDDVRRPLGEAAALASEVCFDRLEDGFRDAHLDVTAEKRHLEVPEWVLEVLLVEDDLPFGERLRLL